MASRSRRRRPSRRRRRPSPPRRRARRGLFFPSPRPSARTRRRTFVCDGGCTRRSAGSSGAPNTRARQRTRRARRSLRDPLLLRTRVSGGPPERAFRALRKIAPSARLRTRRLPCAGARRPCPSARSGSRARTGATASPQRARCRRPARAARRERADCPAAPTARGSGRANFVVGAKTFSPPPRTKRMTRLLRTRVRSRELFRVPLPPRRRKCPAARPARQIPEVLAAAETRRSRLRRPRTRRTRGAPWYPRRARRALKRSARAGSTARPSRVRVRRRRRRVRARLGAPSLPSRRPNTTRRPPCRVRRRPVRLDRRKRPRRRKRFVKTPTSTPPRRAARRERSTRARRTGTSRL
mmetsp:Transcript_13585/g.57132  ORF Transcript_13585/g.57132 Transcript_13585/m.57132 type:complete len:354 (-) Transcript_13585:653-1714(-)